MAQLLKKRSGYTCVQKLEKAVWLKPDQLGDNGFPKEKRKLGLGTRLGLEALLGKYHSSELYLVRLR